MPLMPPRARSSRRVPFVVSAVAIAAALGLAACSGGDGGTEPPPPPPSVSTVSVALASPSIVAGATTQATATTRDASGAVLSGRSVAWSTSSSAVATVSGSGVVTGVAPGQATITATSEGKTGDATVTVTQAPVATVAVTLNASTLTVGQTTQASAVARDVGGNALPGRAVAWSSSDEAIATVNAQGLVTAVAEGTANIVATSEGKTGQAALVVNPDPTAATISDVTITDADGAAVDLNSVAGTIGVGFTADVPAGFRGVAVLRIGGREIGRADVVAPGALARTDAASTALARPVVTGVRVTANTALPVTVIDGETLTSSTIQNGDYLAELALLAPGVGGQPEREVASQGINIRLRNPNTLTGLVLVDGQRLDVNGRTVRSGDVTIVPSLLSYDGAQLDRIEIVRTGHAAVYGSDAVAGVIDVVTRTGADASKGFTIGRDQLAIESAPAGLDFLVRSYRTTGGIGGAVEYRPIEGIVPVLDGRCWNTRGTGFLQPDGAPLPTPLPTGCTSILSGAPLIPPSVYAGTEYVDVASVFHIDNAVGDVQPYFFSLPDRPLTVGGAASAEGRTRCCLDGYIGSSFDLKATIDWSKALDLSGLDDAKTEIYVAPSTSLPQLFTPQFRITTNDDIPVTGATRSLVAGARIFDALGNHRDVPLATSPGNNYTIGGQVGLGNGIEPLLFGYSEKTPTGSLAVSTLKGDVIWNSTAFGASSHVWSLALFDSEVGVPSNWASVRATLDGQPVLGSGTSGKGYSVLLSSGSATSGTAQLPLSSLLNAAWQRYDDRDGLYTLSFSGADRSGNTVRDFGGVMKHRVWVDYTRPTAGLDVTGTIVPGALFDATLLATDAGGDVDGWWAGVQYDLPHGSFDGDFAWSPFEFYPVGDGLAGERLETGSRQITGFTPVGMRFFDPTSGVVASEFYRSRAGVVQSVDVARNTSALHVHPFANTETAPALTNLDRIYFRSSRASACKGTSCSGSPPSIADFTIEVDSPDDELPLAKATFFALGGDRIPRWLGTVREPTQTQVTGGWRTTYTLSYDFRDFCYPTGNYQIAGVGLTADGKTTLKAGQFVPFSVLAALTLTDRCWMPRQSAPPPPKEPKDDF